MAVPNRRIIIGINYFHFFAVEKLARGVYCFGMDVRRFLELALRDMEANVKIMRKSCFWGAWLGGKAQTISRGHHMWAMVLLSLMVDPVSKNVFFCKIFMKWKIWYSNCPIQSVRFSVIFSQGGWITLVLDSLGLW